MTTTANSVAQFVHQVCVYRSDDEYLAMAMPFVADGLGRDEPVLAVTTQANIALLHGALGRAADRVEFIDADQWYHHPATTLAAYHWAYQDRVRSRGGRPGHVRIIGEPVWSGRTSREVTEWTRYESVVNIVFAPTSAWIVCPYDARVLDPEIVADAERTHPARVDGDAARTCPDYVDPAAFLRLCDAAPLAPSPPDAAILPFLGDLSSVRRFVAGWVTRHGPGGEVAAMLAAAVSEVVGYLRERGGRQMMVRAWQRSGTVVCEVRDTMPMTIDPFLGYRPPALDPKPGDGVWLARQVCDLVEIRSSDAGVTIRLHIPV